ncbi:ASCH domain-containing protein [Fibrella forsythiae]|uniref:ASCH domain-containing protein n=1 Tax=Fibrella forsythiae TaxID=2817061 RepID=A0ABS3JBF5_9BACT|nr:ASCH domain-containing protein [Fibrella forsythiae]MBO0947321.1 ASCH domain-containing protein [Fibrella forsythiae]
MKAITLQDDAPKNPVPWLTLVEYKIKTIETRRNWNRPKHRGDTLFTASATSRTPNAGLAVCVANVVDIVPMTGYHEADACIELFDNAWALILEDLRWLTRKFPVKGALGIWEADVPADVEFYVPDPSQLLPSVYPDYLKTLISQSAAR